MNSEACYCTTLSASNPSGHQACVDSGSCKTLDHCSDACLDGSACGSLANGFLSVYIVPPSTLLRRQDMPTTTALAPPQSDISVPSLYAPSKDMGTSGVFIATGLIIALALAVAGCVGWNIWKRNQRELRRCDMGSTSSWRVNRFNTDPEFLKGSIQANDRSQYLNLDTDGFVIIRSAGDTSTVPDTSKNSTAKH
ncbi:hypothetical protein HDU67_005199 [Dinochytrium kinnereticum]|nr:hypothetical protein HDU67_005199 [Dinochytrium kinnereticum]